MSKSKLFAAVVPILYAVTWIGGYFSHVQELAAEAAINYAYVQKVNAERDAGIALNADGPHTGINWCVPVLPGVLIVDSYSINGPLAGRGSSKLVLFYGFGSFVLDEWNCWLA